MYEISLEEEIEEVRLVINRLKRDVEKIKEETDSAQCLRNTLNLYKLLYRSLIFNFDN